MANTPADDPAGDPAARVVPVRHDHATGAKRIDALQEIAVPGAVPIRVVERQPVEHLVIESQALVSPGPGEARQDARPDPQLILVGGIDCVGVAQVDDVRAISAKERFIFL